MSFDNIHSGPGSRKEKEEGDHFYKNRSKINNSNVYPSILKRGGEYLKDKGIYSPIKDFKSTPDPVIYSPPKLKGKAVNELELKDWEINKAANISENTIPDEKQKNDTKLSQINKKKRRIKSQYYLKYIDDYPDEKDVYKKKEESNFNRDDFQILEEAEQDNQDGFDRLKSSEEKNSQKEETSNSSKNRTPEKAGEKIKRLEDKLQRIDPQAEPFVEGFYSMMDESSDDGHGARVFIDGESSNQEAETPHGSERSDYNYVEDTPAGSVSKEKADSIFNLKEDKEEKKNQHKSCGKLKRKEECDCVKLCNPPVNRSYKLVKMPVLLANARMDIDIIHSINLDCRAEQITKTDLAVNSFETRVLLPSNNVFVKGELVLDVEYVSEKTKTLHTCKFPIVWGNVIQVQWMDIPERGKECKKKYTFDTPQGFSTHDEFSQTFTEKVEHDLRNIQFTWHYDPGSQSCQKNPAILGVINSSFDLFQKQYIQVPV